MNAKPKYITMKSFFQLHEELKNLLEAKNLGQQYEIKIIKGLEKIKGGGKGTSLSGRGSDSIVEFKSKKKGEIKKYNMGIKAHGACSGQIQFRYQNGKWFYVAKESDELGSYLAKILNDTVPGLGPSSYSGADINDISNKDGVLNLPALVYDYGANPATRVYADLQKQVNSGSVDKRRTNIDINRGSTTYKYNANTNLVFNRTNDRNVNDDTLALQFTPMDPFTANPLSTLSFLQYINDYKDNFDSTWGDIKYVGRAEKFYIFNEFKRSISLGFTIPCFNKAELRSNHRKLNKLVSILAGKYDNNLI